VGSSAQDTSRLRLQVADGVEKEVHTAIAHDLAHGRRPPPAPVVEDVVGAVLADKIVLRARRETDDRGALELCDLDRQGTHAAGRRRHQDVCTGSDFAAISAVSVIAEATRDGKTKEFVCKTRDDCSAAAAQVASFCE
jgi:hypothetical protein